MRTIIPRKETCRRWHLQCCRDCLRIPGCCYVRARRAEKAFVEGQFVHPTIQTQALSAKTPTVSGKVVLAFRLRYRSIRQERVVAMPVGALAGRVVCLLYKTRSSGDHSWRLCSWLGSLCLFCKHCCWGKDLLE